ncbi:leucine-rich repeat-containing protein 74A-like [Myzus persicae]|uniref:leucine-rich repeat-containing protein 74A-like n=1 Tax=Myzus persicae TaxID=13164 RepID=UPI000B93336A|nr:leucine-rich repeat-containing protein 74A-like [Myzus persicae]
MDESDTSVQTNYSSEIFTIDHSNQEIAEYGNGMFLKLRDRDISATANIIDSTGATDQTTDQEDGIAVPITIDLSFNDITDCACLQKLLKASEMNIPTNTYIQELNLSNNSIRGECVHNIISFLDTNDRLQKLNLSGNFLNKETALSALTKAIGDSNETLQVLSLDWNGISGEVCANIFRNLMIKSKSLKKLDLSWNNFSDVGKILGQGINLTTRLEHLDLSNNPLTNEDIVDILSGIVNPTSLRSLGISHVFVDEQVETAISKAQSRVPNISVKVAIYTDMKSDPVFDKKTLYLQRIHFLGVTKPKKKKRKFDIGHVLLKMKNDGNLEPMKFSLFISTFANLKVKGVIMELIEGLANQFRNADKTINVALMLDKYLDLYPDTTL